ncbi:MAG: hypothetical protein JWN86_3330 [Planctomycetota bacterium]|nr:hypothetical protein [Planctomycetota bacterium]
MPRTALILLFLLTGPILARGDDLKASSSDPRLIEQPRADYRARRKELMDRVNKSESSRISFSKDQGGETIVVLRGEDDRGQEDFEEGRFRQKNDFAYLTGLEVPGAWLVLRPRQNRATLYLPSPTRSHMNGQSRHPGPGKDAAEQFGFDAVEPNAKLLGDLFTAIADPMRDGAGTAVVYTMSPSPDPHNTKPDAKFVRFLREGAPNTTFRDLAPVVGEMRKLKSKSELVLLQKAIDITGDANEEVLKIIGPGLFEYQLEGRILGAFLNGGALRPGFQSIVGSGPNSTIPHYFLSSRKMAEGDLVVVDIGAEYNLYTADVTRTYPVNGTFSPRQREIYQLVLDAQTEAANRVKPGSTRLVEMTGIARGYLRKSPLRAKDSDGKEFTMDHFFVHGLSHYLGMDVHDVGDMNKPMQPGEVFTIEPGIYIESENLGVRIEDDYLVTESGLVKLSKNIPSEPDEIEKRIATERARKKHSD